MVKTKTNFKLYFDLAFYQAIMLMNYLTLLFRSIEDISRPLSTFLFIALIIAADVIGIKGYVRSDFTMALETTATFIGHNECNI